MPTTFTDQFFTIDPYNPPPAGTPLTFARYDLIDQNDDNDIDRFNNDSVDGQDVTSSWPGDTVTVNVPGVGNITYTGTTFYLADGRQVFTPTDGQVLQNGTLVSASGVTTQGPLNTGTDLGPTCFTAGTMIDTPDGKRAIETLRPGDPVNTRDNGAQPVLWIGRRTFPATGICAPVRICKGALDNDADLVVSQQHRMLISGWRAELYLGVEETLVAARHLVNGDTIYIAEGDQVEYFHLLFADHEIVNAAGIPSESYHPGHAATLADRETQKEIQRVFPELDAAHPNGWIAARQVARQHEGRMLVA